MNNRQRRRFLGVGAKTMAGAGLALGGNPFLTLAQAQDGTLDTGGGDDYRALVCVFLHGGIDGFSLLVPTGTAEYDAYQRSRGTLALSRSQLLDLVPRSGAGLGSGESLGLHESARPLLPLFEDGRLAVIANVGNLIEPTSRALYESGDVDLPSQLFSHSDQQIQWQQLQGPIRTKNGWGALAADYLAAEQQRDYLTSISVAGSNYWQSGEGQRPFAVRESGVLTHSGLDVGTSWQQPRAEAFDRVLQLQSRNVFEQAYNDLHQRARNNTTELGALLSARYPNVEDNPVSHDPEEDQLAARLNMVAKLISLHAELGMKRQIFYVGMGGFDVHDNQNRALPELFGSMANALSGFQTAMDMFGLSENVTTFTASDFGRSLTSNGDGTDHGWGNHMLAMGGAVNGGTVYGSLPVLDVDGPDSVQNGRIVPSLAASQYASTLLDWLGLDDSRIDTVLPTLSNFSSRNLGFMHG